MAKIIYPDISITENKPLIKVETYIRKSHNGQWYLWHIRKNYKITKNYHNSFLTILNMFNNEAYLKLTLGVVQDSVIEQNTYIILDENQDTENQRLMKLLKL